jgi:predicted dehydrogenase
MRVGLVGAGVAGERHAAALRALPGARLCAVHDTDRRRAEALAARFDAPLVAADLVELLPACDALVVASPASTHAAVALAALEAGRHVLVERPIATKRDEARAMIAAARERGLVLRVGHREEPVMRALALLDAPEAPRVFEATRDVLPREHVADVSVVQDLMIQDLFVAARLFAAPAVAVRATKLAGRPGVIDAAEARLRFRGGAEAVVRASRVASARNMLWRLDYGEGHLRVDFIKGEIDRKTRFKGPRDFPAQDGDPVAQGLMSFLAACADPAGAERDEGAAHALAALDLALHVEDILRGAR